jgi:imidazole glycerol-phosphate synthase subunit HisH
MADVVIVDYGLGNLKSISNMIAKTGSTAIISHDLKTIEAAKRIILPGVGSFDFGMSNIKQQGLHDMLHQKIVTEATPTLGICLGMQLLGTGSEEGSEKGLGFVPVSFKKFPNDEKHKVPHIGWSEVNATPEHFLFSNINIKPLRYYFVHSYYAVCENPEIAIATTQYGLNFCSAYQHNNIFGVQFHPEKSHLFGMTLLKNFINYQP